MGVSSKELYVNFFKRVFDLLFASIILLITTPLFLIIALGIKTSSKGNAFFIQERLGKNGEVFKIYKFRTMVQGTENSGTGIFTSFEDPRITKIGHLLRKTSLDEIPQLLNVLKGEMSLVGPRPPVPYHPYKYHEYSNEQKQRFYMSPGITGYAQVIGRNTLSWEQRIVLDIEYIKKVSFLLDLKILIKTIFVFANKKEIYNLKSK